MQGMEGEPIMKTWTGMTNIDAEVHRLLTSEHYLLISLEEVNYNQIKNKDGLRIFTCNAIFTHSTKRKRKNHVLGLINYP
jgi:hypothetical protein